MIRVRKPPLAPRILRERGMVTTEANRAAFDSSPPDYLNGNKKFEFDRTIYAAKSVKNALTKAQHEKCCFCESKVTHIAYGDVEHFRPKAGFRQTQDDSLGRPGYYWLAYNWENLFFSCQLCNQRFKKNLFPLRDSAQRARSHHDDVAEEEPLFIDPAAMDPTTFISFRDEYPYAIGGNQIGKTTIQALGLDREALNERRRDYLHLLKLIQTLASMAVPEGAEARTFLVRAIDDSAEYAAMARAALA